MSALRENYWILKSRKTVRRVLSECIICKRFTVKPLTTLSPPLPEDRVREAQIFEITGVDLCGPLFLTDRTKSWIVLFTCAVHMELVTSLSTESFILALRRFISRRGRPFTIYSDNGKNLVGTSNELKNIDWKKVKYYGSLKKIIWKLNLPSSPWWWWWGSGNGL
ncbi:integrase catalytic domain-containing protein [Trichonephila clavipes]|nr:integrase catalytic domain-containing protein [Trichonephila clavipes]